MFRTCLALACSAALTTAAFAAPCRPALDPALGTPGVADSLVGVFYPTDFFFTGGPKRLVIGGGFSSIGGVANTSGVAVWDGTSFSPLGAGLRFDGTAEVSSAITFGGSLYLSGQFAGSNAFGPLPQVDSRGIIRWDGSSWHVVNTSPFTGGTAVRAMAVYKGELYVGGNIQQLGTQTALNGIGRYDPVANDFLPVGGGANTTTAFIADMVVFNDGSGEKLYVAGNFTGMGGVPSTRWVARWDGTQWETVGGGIPSASSPSNQPRDLVVFDDGSGPALYVAGGRSNTSGGTSGVHKWDGSTWTAIQGLADDPLDVNYTASSIGVVNDGTGASLWTQVRVSQTAGANPRQHMFKLENGQFDRVPDLDFGSSSVFEITQFDDGSGSKTWLGGSFTAITGGSTPVAATRLARVAGCATTCAADFDQDGNRTIDDIFIFINTWFQGCP